MTKTSENDVLKDEATDEAAPEPRLGPDGRPMAPEYGGPKGPEPTRHGEWEINGRVSDF